MYDWLAGKNFGVAQIPADILEKREKLAKRAEKGVSDETAEKKPPKQNKAAAAKKLKKQAEGLELAERIVNDLF